MLHHHSCCSCQTSANSAAFETVADVFSNSGATEARYYRGCTLPSLSSASRIICASLKGGMYTPPAGPAGLGARSRSTGSAAATAAVSAGASASLSLAAGPPFCKIRKDVLHATCINIGTVLWTHLAHVRAGALSCTVQHACRQIQLRAATNLQGALCIWRVSVASPPCRAQLPAPARTVVALTPPWRARAVSPAAMP
jgi:hypothetical protein